LAMVNGATVNIGVQVSLLCLSYIHLGR
jgi:hypothetical protein